jgi:hypothetical protein
VFVSVHDLAATALPGGYLRCAVLLLLGARPRHAFKTGGCWALGVWKGSQWPGLALSNSRRPIAESHLRGLHGVAVQLAAILTLHGLQWY